MSASPIFIRPLFFSLAIIGVLAIPTPGAAQNITPQQIEQLRNNPDLVRQRLRQSGLSDAQVRQRLSEAGYAPTLFDDFLAGRDSTRVPILSADALAALATFDLDPADAQGLEPVPSAIGPQFVDSLALEVDSGVMEEEELALFGLDVFRRTGALFQPSLSGPVPSDYRIGPGDEMVLVLTGAVELIRELSVVREGFVIIPQVGRIMVNSLTMEQLRTLLARRLGTSYSGISNGTTTFDVSITRLRTNQVFVTGEVMQPSAYQLSSLATALNAIYAAGGLTENANFRSVQIRRNNAVVATLDLYDYLLAGNTGGDVGLQQGDVVFVPVHGTRAKVRGAVVRPSEYELAPDQSLRELIAAAGGFRADAALRRVSISRIVPPAQRGPSGPARIVVDVPVDQIQDGLAPPFPIEPGDEVIVAEIPEESRSFVEVSAGVLEPGRYGWRAGLMLSDVVTLAGGVQPAAYTGRAHISRLNVADSTRFLVNAQLPANPALAWPNDVTLQELDIITIYNRVEFRADRMVAIGGMVNEPGNYPYHEGMTLRDLILQARGLRDGAYLDTLEIARLPEDRSGGRLAATFRIGIDSTYLVDDRTSSYTQLPGVSRVPASGTEEFLLRPFDQVSVLRAPDFEFLRRVIISGEVRFPGPYALNSKDESISDLVERAGGLLPTAFADGARFFRNVEANETLGRFPQSPDQVTIELARALTEPRGLYDFSLQPGDSLYVPEYEPTVRVEGAVLAPVRILYQEGENLDYYVENAGGYTREADKGRVSVEYANGARRQRSGRFLFFGGASPKPGPGSTITVPVKNTEDRLDSRGLISDIVAISASVATVVLVAIRR